jgi:hypothetical protein
MASLASPTAVPKGLFTRIPLDSSICFRAYVQAELLGLDDPQARTKAALLCLYAWDTALLPSASRREEKIFELLNGMDGPASSDPEYRVWFIDTMLRLIERKRSCFPGTLEIVDRSELTPRTATEDILIVGVQGTATEYVIPVITFHDPSAIPDRLRNLRNWACDLGARAEEVALDEATPWDVEQLLLQCGVWRCELDALKSAADLMHHSHEAPSVRRVTGNWRAMAADLDNEVRAIGRRARRRVRMGLGRRARAARPGG